MHTLVECIYHPKGKEVFAPAEIAGQFCVDASPKQVLETTLPVYFLEAYQGLNPWMVTVGNNRGYLKIEKAENRHTQGNIKRLLRQDFMKYAKRKHELTGDEKRELAQSVLNNFEPDSYLTNFLNHQHGSVMEVCDVLGILGVNLSFEELSQKLKVQYDRQFQEEMRDRIRRAEDWEALAGKVVGAECP